jgi:hypothetical protein
MAGFGLATGGSLATTRWYLAGGAAPPSTVALNTGSLTILFSKFRVSLRLGTAFNGGICRMGGGALAFFAGGGIAALAAGPNKVDYSLCHSPLLGDPVTSPATVGAENGAPIVGAN